MTDAPPSRPTPAAQQLWAVLECAGKEVISKVLPRGQLKLDLY
jgi:hypothetical protein